MKTLEARLMVPIIVVGLVMFFLGGYLATGLARDRETCQREKGWTGAECNYFMMHGERGFAEFQRANVRAALQATNLPAGVVANVYRVLKNDGAVAIELSGRVATVRQKWDLRGSVHRELALKGLSQRVVGVFNHIETEEPDTTQEREADRIRWEMFQAISEKEPH